MYFYLALILTIYFIFLGKGILYILEKLIECVFIPLINRGYKVYNVPYSLQLNKFFVYEDINDNIQETKKIKKFIDEKLD